MKQSSYFYLLLRSLFLVHPEIATSTTSDPPDGVLIYLYPSGSILSLVSQHIFLPLRNRWYSCPLGLAFTPITPISLACSRSSFLFGYSNLLAPLVLEACFCCCAFFLAIHCLLVLEAIILKSYKLKSWMSPCLVSVYRTAKPKGMILFVLYPSPRSTAGSGRQSIW